MSWVERTKNQEYGGLDDATLDSDAVIFLRGKNTFGDPIWSYLKLTLRNFAELNKRVQANQQFNPGEFGEVLYAGQGEPFADIRNYMQEEYDLVDFDMQIPSPSGGPIPQPTPSMGDEDDEDETGWETV